MHIIIVEGRVDWEYTTTLGMFDSIEAARAVVETFNGEQRLKTPYNSNFDEILIYSRVLNEVTLTHKAASPSIINERYTLDQESLCYYWKISSPQI